MNFSKNVRKFEGFFSSWIIIFMQTKVHKYILPNLLVHFTLLRYQVGRKLIWDLGFGIIMIFKKIMFLKIKICSISKFIPLKTLRKIGEDSPFFVNCEYYIWERKKVAKDQKLPRNIVYYYDLMNSICWIFDVRFCVCLLEKGAGVKFRSFIKGGWIEILRPESTIEVVNLPAVHAYIL